MIKKLKKKYIIIATISMFALMAILVLIMNLVNYSSVISECDEIVEMFSKNNAPFNDDKNPPEKPEDKSSDKSDDKPNKPFDFMPPGMSPEVPYESRYFIAMVNANGEVNEADLTRIISVDSESAKDYIDRALNSKKSKGFIGDFRYSKSELENGMTKIVFLDCGRKMDAFNSFLWTSIMVGIVGCLIVFAVFLFVSGRIVKPIAESYEKQKRFISDAGHEIKTPLTIINANVDILDSEEDKNIEELDEIRTQTKRLTELTNNLVYLSKMEETDHFIKKIDMPLSDIVSETANPFKVFANTNNIEFVTNIENNISINGSPDSIRHLVSILLDNAIKYSPDGGRIELNLIQNKKTVSLIVSNQTNELIKEEDLKFVFDRFYRTDTSRNSSTGGHGIGLSIAKAIVEAHNGSIQANSKTGNDFIINVVLPL